MTIILKDMTNKDKGKGKGKIIRLESCKYCRMMKEKLKNKNL